MARLVDPEPLDVGPVEHLEQPRLPRHLRRPLQRLEGDVPRARLRPGHRDHLGERQADPGDHHRPALDAAQPVDPLLEPLGPHDVVERVAPRPVAEPVDRHRPGRGGQPAGVRRRVALVGPELVEVVVAGDHVERARRVGGRPAARGARERRRRPGRGQQRRGREPGGAGQELPPPEIRRLRRHVRIPEPRHASPSPACRCDCHFGPPSARVTPTRGKVLVRTPAPPPVDPDPPPP